ncbi:uncharacterized protein LOC114752970 [Neltuma alba]|uniref:uncharacterized protein LOC114752970 n=1 Tax=Neltuma alba TaxID=207710 RepID=UPI0010A2EE1D|nr:uncharacterized protein LOC114752970 [Prosopis alba]
MSINLIPDKDEVEYFWWRNLGFLSSIIGLLSYRLSSSFHFMFGEMNTWKTLLYIFLSLIFPYSIFFVKTWKPLQNLLFRSHLAFLVLLLSSIYSYFYDKFVKEKPDMFSLLSTGSFALTSLSLKRQNIQLGFEDDLLKFFLGFLTIQLMKINLLLALVGAALCYFAIVLIPWSLGSPLETVSCITALQENVAIKIDCRVSDLRKQLCSTQLGIVNDSENPERFVYPSDFESRLKDAIASGLVQECYDAFITWRKQFLNDQMTTMGFQNLSINEVPRLPMKTLKNDIEEWTKACHLVVKRLFPQERHACSVVFSALSPGDELSFMEVCRGIMARLLNYAKAVLTTAQSPEHLVTIVVVLDTLEEILPDMESLFCNKICEFLYDEAIAVSKRLGEAITGVFMELENLIGQDPAKVNTHESQCLICIYQF